MSLQTSSAAFDGGKFSEWSHVWALGASTLATVRNKVYALIPVAIARVPEAAGLAQEGLARDVIATCLAESSEENYRNLWAAILSLATSFPGAYPTDLAGLWRMLRHGFSTSATASYPSMLPLLSTLPAAKSSAFLDCIWEGVRNQFQSSALVEAEKRAILQSLSECFRYCARQPERASEEDVEHRAIMYTLELLDLNVDRQTLSEWYPFNTNMLRRLIMADTRHLLTAVFVKAHGASACFDDASAAQKRWQEAWQQAQQGRQQEQRDG